MIKTLIDALVPVMAKTIRECELGNSNPPRSVEAARFSWYNLTPAEADRLNPPWVAHCTAFDALGDAFYDTWLPVGYIPRPRTRLGWFVYHLVHGLAMRYPLHKVLGYALSNTRPE